MLRASRTASSSPRRQPRHTLSRVNPHAPAIGLDHPPAVLAVCQRPLVLPLAGKSPTVASKPPTVASKPPVLADGRYDAYIRQVNTRGDYLVIDLVQVFD